MKNKGFTLIELSIVLIITALLISVVLIGKSLIHTAQLREVVSEYDRYVKSIAEFKDKYQALPGDMINSEVIWGSDTACPNTVTNTIVKNATCNGDGNGRIGASSATGVLDTSKSYEWFRAWQQLANAGLVDGKFTGVKESTTDGDAGIGINVPQSKLEEKAGWTLYYFLNTVDTTSLWGDNYGHLLSFGGDSTSITNGVALTPSDALSIDQKIDDGLPGRGTIRAWRTVAQGDCTVVATDTTQDAATYNASYTGQACSLLFILGF